MYPGVLRYGVHFALDIDRSRSRRDCYSFHLRVLTTIFTVAIDITEIEYRHIRSIFAKGVWGPPESL